MKRSLLLFLAWTAIFAHVAETFADSVEPWYMQTADLMGFVRDDAQVWKLTMPASHDAGMSDTATRRRYDPADEYYSAQYGPLSEQLAADVRYFDLRPCPDGEVIKAWHGQKVAGVYWDRFGETFADMLDDARDFLEAHRSETVFFHIGHWSGDGQDPEKVKNDVIDILPNDSFPSQTVAIASGVIPESGTGCGLVRTTSEGKDCLLWTIPTHKGLDYVVSTGRTLDGLKKTGTYKGTNDNLSLPLILEPGTTSGFLSVAVTWGLE